MNIFATESTASIPVRKRVESGGEAPPEPIPIQTLRGGDAADIVPDDLLRKTVGTRATSEEDDAETIRKFRGEFAALQRVLETRIARYDAELEVAFEDSELIIYQLETERDFENILDFCEIEETQFRRGIVELMEAIAAERTTTDAEYALVVRKPTAFRAGERHARTRFTGSVHDD